MRICQTRYLYDNHMWHVFFIFILSGGIRITAVGDNLNSVFTPVFYENREKYILSVAFIDNPTLYIAILYYTSCKNNIFVVDISIIKPQFGPRAGGTLVTIIGQGLNFIEKLVMERSSFCANYADIVYERNIFDTRYCWR